LFSELSIRSYKNIKFPKQRQKVIHNEQFSCHNFKVFSKMPGGNILAKAVLTKIKRKEKK